MAVSLPLQVTSDHALGIPLQAGSMTVKVVSGDTVYYADQPFVTASSNQGSLTNGNSQSFTTGVWVRSASGSAVTVSPSGVAGAAGQAQDVVLGTDGTVGGPGGTALTSTAATLASPALTGTPTAPTAAVDTNTTQLSTTAFVLAQAASAAPVIDGVAAVGTSTRYARGDHVHPTDTSRAPTASPTLSGTTTMSGALTHTGTTVGFYNVTPATRPAAYTLTYATNTRTLAADSIVDPAVTAATQTTPWGYSTAAQADAIRAAAIEHHVEINNIRQVLRQVIVDLQANGLLQ